MPTPTLDELIAGAKSAKRQTRDVDFTLDAGVADQVEALDEKIEQTEQQRIEISERADADLAAAKADARLGDPRAGEITAERDRQLAEIDERIDALRAERDGLTEGTLITARFTQLPGQAWAEIIARCPARPDVLIDRRYGYNYHEAAKRAIVYRDPEHPEVAYSERVLVGEGDEKPTTEPISPEQWEAIWPILSGNEFERIASGVWDLNDYGPSRRVAAAGKASRAGSAQRSS